MKKLRWCLGFLLTILVCCGAAAAVENDIVKVGLRYGGSAMFSANLENAVGSGYAFGYYDSGRNFVEVGKTGRTAVSVTAAGTIYLGSSGYYETDQGQGSIGKWRAEAGETYGSYEEAAAAAESYPGSHVAYLSDTTACVLAAMRRRTRPFWPSPAPDWTAESWRPAVPAWW